MSEELTKIIHSTVLESRIPAKNVAKEVGKPYSTLLREINPYDPGAKLGIETFFQIIKITGDISPLEYMADALGMQLTPKRGMKTG